MSENTPWRAKSWYWKLCGLFILAVAIIVPLLTSNGEPVETALVFFVLASPFVVWMMRIAAWEEPSALAVRNLFRTKRIPWGTISQLELSDTAWNSGGYWSRWIYGAVRHNGQKTYIKALIAVEPFGPDVMVAELRDLAERRDLPVNEASVDEFAL